MEKEIIPVTLDKAATTVKDPVCGMDVDPQATKHTSEHQGRTYCFCSLMCRKAFEDDPEHYLKKRPA